VRDASLERKIMDQATADKILEVIDSRGWAQGDQNVGRADQPVCLGIAVNVGLGLHHLYATYERIQEALAATRELTGQIRWLYRERSAEIERELGRVTLPSFNDHKDTTEEDVRLVIKHAVT
jgi:hypothetical protein